MKPIILGMINELSEEMADIVNAKHPPAPLVGIISDYNITTHLGTDNSARLQAIADYCKTNHKTLNIPTGNYLLNSTVIFDSIDVISEDAYYTMFYCNTNITAFNLIGGRKIFQKLNVWFDLLAPATVNAIGFKLGANTYGDSRNQFSNNTCIQLYARNAYRGFVTNSAGTTGTLWNNTFINCRSDLQVEYGVYFDSIVGSTSQTFINCYCIGDDTLTTSKGFYFNKIDNINIINCQVDKVYDGNALNVNVASDITINGLQIESCKLRTNASRFIYLNAKSVIENIKIRSCEMDVGASNRGVIIALGASSGGGRIGEINLEAFTITSGTLYKIDTNGLQFGKGSCLVSGSDIKRSDIRLDDVGNRTIFLNKTKKIAVDNNNPTEGNWEIGDTLDTIAIAAGKTIGKICTSSGTAGTLSSVTGSITAGTRALAVNTTNGLSEGAYISIAGVTGNKKIVHVFSTTLVYIDTDASNTVSGAAVAYINPTFANYGIIELQGSITWDATSLIDGAGETSAAITVTGAALGDFVLVSAPFNLQGIIANAYVESSNTIKIRLQNETGITVDLASGIWKVKVIKQ